MEEHKFTARSIFRNSVYSYLKKHKTSNSKGVVIPFVRDINLNYEKTERVDMRYFLLNKQNSVEENVLFTAKILYEQLEDTKLHIDQLFLEFVKKQNITLNLNIERILYLALTFLFSIGKINFTDNMIERVDGK
ncbi:MULTISPECIES: ABC-three component system middle component 6 [Bacillus cereus group]|uniref:ABC-three component system middle component 6 n=1 Tax=Bacillus cereus group TaxID=86661 RepID=UPI001CC2227B|nr:MULTISPECIES: ABC-three component system middle component 6 [Bacillus cereus group]